MPGTIYFMQRGNDGPIKVGFTNGRVSTRLSNLQVGCPDPIYLLAEVAGTPEQEDSLHRMFSSIRVRGEWFRPSVELLDLIELLHEGVALESYVEKNDDCDGSDEGRRGSEALQESEL